MKTRRLLIIFPVLVLLFLGFVMIFDTSSAEVLDQGKFKETHIALIKQLIYALGGLSLAFAAKKMGFTRFIAYSPQVLAFFSFLLVLTFAPGIGRAVNGSHRWISLFGVSFQPSEFVKYLVPAYLIHVSLTAPETFHSFVPFLKLVGRVSVPLGLILIEPNNGTTAVIGMTALVFCFLYKVPFKFWGIPLVFALAIGVISAASLPYVQGRLKSYLHPELDLKGKGHQPYQAKIAAGSGGLFGKGPGSSLQKLSYLPEAQNDYIAAIFAEEYGFLGMTVLITLYMALTFGGMLICYTTTSSAAYLFGCIIVFLISFQSFLNLGVVSGLLPSTGLNLPFFSQGGTSLLANMMGLGLLLDINTSTREWATEL